ncbi:STAS domain-containing protein [Streptomyces sp. SGAir0957]
MGTPPPGLRVQVVDAGDTVLLRLSGELDIATAPGLQAALTPLTGRRVELDLGDLTFIDSIGITLLARHHSHAAATGGLLLLVAAGRAVRRVLDITGITHLLGPPPPDNGHT